jgi:TolB-like protein/Flp pilus assembly protein TadD
MDDAPATGFRFVAELRRRRVPRALLVYAAASFAILEPADILIPALRLPEWTMSLLAVLLILGAAVAAVLAWVLELTPEGLKRTTSAAGGVSSDLPWLSLRTASLALLLVAIGAAAGWFARPGSGDAAAGLDPRSIAVLPFANLGGDAEAAAFAAGIHDDLLTHLTRIGELKVISRTSVMEYAGARRNLRDIARALGVATVLEGGVQWVGGRVRINMQLIDAHTDGHIWAEQYDRELTAENLFAIQAEIARAVAQALRATLTPGARGFLERVPTASLSAYRLYARAASMREGHQGRYQRERMELQTQLLEDAVQLDSTFAEAWAELGRVRAQLYWFHYDRSAENVHAAKQAVDRALAIRSDLPEGHVALGLYHFWCELDYDRALAAFEQARAGLPGEGEIDARMAYVYRRRSDQVELAVRHLERARDLSPRMAGLSHQLAETYQLVRRYPDALTEYDRALALDPSLDDSRIRKADIYLHGIGEVNAARRELALLPDDAGGQFQITHERALVEIYARDWAAAQRLLEQGPEVFQNQFYYVPRALLAAQVHSAIGETKAAHVAYASALQHLLARRREDPADSRYLSAQALAMAGLGRYPEAVRAARLATELLPVEVEAWRGAWRLEDLARVYAAAGEKSRAMDILERLLSNPGEAGPGMLRLDPAWDPLRSEPRFLALLRALSS